jgi:hypothetical protein
MIKVGKFGQGVKTERLTKVVAITFHVRGIRKQAYTIILLKERRKEGNKHYEYI